MKHFLRYSFVALMAMFMGNAFGQEVVFDFTDEANPWGLPTEQLKETGTFTKDGMSIVITTTNYTRWFSDTKTLLIGKKDATLTLPAFDFDVEQIDVVGSSGASAAVTQNIFVGDEAVSTETTGAKDVTNTYKIAEGKQAAGTIYTLKVTSNHNTQVTKILVWKKGTVSGGENNESTSPENPMTVSGIQMMEILAKELKTYNVESNPFYVKGKIAKIGEVNTQYGNASFYIADEVTDTYQMYVFRSKYLEKANFTAEDQIKVGDEVIIYGTFVLYKKDDASDPVPEIKNCYIYSLNGKTKDDGGDTPDPGIKSLTVEEALDIINGLGDGKKTDEEYLVEGEVLSIDEISTQYGNATFDIWGYNTQNEATYVPTIKVYRAKGLNNENITDENIIKVGDKVVVRGKLQKYVKNDVVTPEVTNGYLISVESGSAETKGDANGDNVVNAADIVELVNYIMGSPSDKFNESAADVNGDGVVNAADIVLIVNIIMGN